MDSASPFLAPWSNFYILVGSAAGALTGLLFVVITIVMNTGRRNALGISAFTTPTLIHFGSVLLVAATLSAPWKILVCPAVMIGIAGFVGVIYISRLATIAARLEEYRADLEDWTWYFALPGLAYATLLIGSLFLLRASGPAMFAIGGAALLLAFIGIRNSWDIVTYITIREAEDEESPTA